MEAKFNVLITGGSGFIGTNLVEYYLRCGCSVLNLDINCPRNICHKDVWRRVDILDSPSLDKAVAAFSPDIIFHMAARTDLSGRDIGSYAVNTDGVRNIISSIRKIGCVQRVVFASSMLVCRLGYVPSHDLDYQPANAYGESKCRGEDIVREFGVGIPWAIVRPTSLWGPWFDVPYRGFFDAVRKGYFFLPKGVDIFRSYGFVLNSIAQLDRIINVKQDEVVGRTFYLADYEPTSLRAWADCIRRSLNVRKVRDIPQFALRAAAKIGDVLKLFGIKNPPLTSMRLQNMLTNAVFDMTPLRNVCGPLPYALNEGVKITTAWMTDQSNSFGRR